MTRDLFKQAKDIHLIDDYKNFTGVSLEDIKQYEKLFNINVNVFSLSEDNKGEIVYRSECDHKDEINLNMYVVDDTFEAHFSYIKDITKYAANYACDKCQRMFNTLKQMTRHMRTCTGEQIVEFPGGDFTPKQNIMQKLQEKNILSSNEDHYYPYFICWDLESFLLKQNKERGVSWKSDTKHEVCSFSVMSNIPGHNVEPVFMSFKTTHYDLTNDFVKTVLEMAATAKSLMRTKYKNTISYFEYSINRDLTEMQTKLVEAIKNDSDVTDLKKSGESDENFIQRIKLDDAVVDKYVKTTSPMNKNMHKEISKKYSFYRTNLKMFQSLNQFINQCPVLGFNSQKYDCNVIKKYLFRALQDNDSESLMPIKRGNSYMAISCATVCFLDIINYLAPGFSLAKFIKAFGCKEVKGHFPYEWFDSVEKLEHKELPPKSAFYSKLKDTNITDEDYKRCLGVWKDNNMNTMRDFLKWYNNLDVSPMVEAITKMRQFYINKNIDLFKDGITVPGLSNKIMFNSIEDDTKFSLFSQENKDIYYLLKNSIVGGPSIVFNRYHEKNKTKLRDRKHGKVCKKVIGFDANALYLWALGLLMPTGDPTQKIYENGTTPNELTQILSDIKNDKLFGFIELDIHTPEHLKTKFSEFTPIFKNTIIREQDIGDHMQNHYKENDKKYVNTKKLIGSYFGEKIVLYTPLIKWYLEKGLVITKVYQTISYTPKACFKKFADDVSDARRTGDLDKDKAIIADTMKLIGNSGYGVTVMDVFKHSTVKHCDKSVISQYINKNFFVGCTKLTPDHLKDSVSKVDDLGGEMYEVDMVKSMVKVGQPIQIGCAVYQLAKLKMLSFYYDFLDKYIDRSDFEMVQMDTDSCYAAFTDNNIENLIRPEMYDDYIKHKYDWFPSTSNDEFVYIDECVSKGDTPRKLKMTRAQYDKRTPGLMKEEARLDGIVALCAKMYYGFTNDDKGNELREDGTFKFSSKGLQHSLNYMDKKRYIDVLLNGKKDFGLNRGFQLLQGTVCTYELSKSGLTYCYDKRRVLADGVSTVPLDI